MTNSADPDQLASLEANCSGSTLSKSRAYSGSTGQRLTDNKMDLFQFQDKYGKQ